MADSPRVQVRRAIADDASAVADVLQRSFAPLRRSYTPAAFAATTPSAAVVQQRLAEGPTWLALRDGVPVGTVSAVARGADLHVRSMAVLTEARGLGIGRRLLDEVEGFARSEGHRRLTLSTTPFLDTAIALYRSAGFVLHAEGPTDLLGIPLLGMAKRLR